MDCAVIGGGASGLVASIVALRLGFKVTIYEKNSKVGKKILATGNGRCNVTNENLNISKFHGEDRDFIRFVLNRFDLQRCKRFFNDLGLEFYKKDNGRYYPLSLQASSVVDVLLHEVKSLGGIVKTDAFVQKIEKKDEKFILTIDEKKYLHDKVLISTGSGAMPRLGSSESGYAFANAFGHAVNPTFASLVQIVCKEDNLVANGAKFKASVQVLVDNRLKTEVKDDVLITKYGLSGSSILDVSREVGLCIIMRKKVRINVDCLCEYSKQDISNKLFSFIKKSPKKPVILVLNGLLNKKLALLILNRCKISPQKTNLGKKEINSISYMIKNLSFTPIDTKGKDFCEVVAGGISTLHVDKKTLQSKLVKGLYFSGEVLDVDGDCGGYNLHWAWASGFVSGHFNN